jgi:TetR/AcrR family transcriptional repressor of lmrAB and yxaGH operons
MPPALVPRDVVLDRLLDTLRTRGYDGASLGELSAATGLGKSSLYHHFPGGKQQMAAAVLAHLDAKLQASLYAALDGAGTPQQRLDAALAAIDAFYEGGRRACLLERLVASVEREQFGPALGRTFHAWVEGFAAVARDAGVCEDEARARAEDAVIRVEGALILCAGTGDLAVFGRALARIRVELLR